MKQKCTATSYKECFSCKFSDCIRAITTRRLMEDEPRIESFLPVKHINDGRKGEKWKD